VSIRFLSFLSILGLSMGPLLQAQQIQLKVPGVADDVLVSLPENHDPAKSWPVVFSYHGFNGKPEVKMTRSHTGPKDWIVVGMGYVQQGKYQIEPADLAMELRAFRYVRDELIKSQGLDPKRIYLAGYSKGGWMTDTLLQAEPGIAGGAILMGGHIDSRMQKPVVLDKKTKVFIGVGRLDPNYLFSLKALVHYRSRGLETFIEPWPGLKHEFPKEGSVGLREWFALQNGGTPDEGALRPELKTILSLSPKEAWTRLIAFKDRPFCNVERTAWPKQIAAELARLEKIPEVAREVQIRNTHRQLLAREAKMRTLEELQRINAAYAKLASGSNDSPRSAEIEHDFTRVQAVLRSAGPPPTPKPKPGPLTPSFPDDGRRVPGNPLVR
jgi:predicted esterase